MTTVEYGGGPSLEQRKEFSNVKPGGRIPGYMGFCPQFKYEAGKTYGVTTHELATRIPYFNRTDKQRTFDLGSLSENRRCGDGQLLFKDEIPARKLPKPTGDNKYTENMIPGYSGDIPHYNFKFGATYKNICDECIDEFVGTFDQQQSKLAETRKMASMFPQLRPIAVDPGVRNHLNYWTDKTMRSNQAGAADQRCGMEAPIPGYNGYVPRVRSTAVSLGQRYTPGSARGLDLFRSEVHRHFERLGERANTVCAGSVSCSQTLAPIPKSPSKGGGRIFISQGMIPAYTGHVHMKKSAIGNTYGDTTRSLDVCAHNYPSFGEFVRHQEQTVQG